MNTIIKKKKKAFTLIELIIVLAIMAIIAAIAIPSFSTVRDNSKIKADKQSIETIKRTVMLLVADETIKPSTANKTAVFSTGTPTYVGFTTAEQTAITGAVSEVKVPQAVGAVNYRITVILTTGDVTVETINSVPTMLQITD